MGRTRSRIWRAAGAMLLAASALSALSALPALPANAREAVVTYDNVRFQRYGVEDGLSQTSARAMLQDEQGFVWIGTQDGLNRFDGYEFRVYRSDPRQPDSLPNNHITALERSRRGGFWVATLAGGLGRYVPEDDCFVRYQADGAPGSLATNAINTVHETADGTLWVAGAAGELQWLAPGSERFQSVPSPLGARIGPVRAIQPRGQRLLLGSATGLWLLEPGGQRAVAWADASVMYAVASIEAAPEGGGVWVGTQENGLLWLDPDGALKRQWRPDDGLAGEEVMDLQFDRDGRLWIATFNGLSRLDTPDSAPRTWRFGSGLGGTLVSSRIRSLMLGRDGLLWVGSWLNGVSLHVPQSRAFAEIQVRPVGPGDSGVAVYAVEIDQDGTLWLGVAEALGLIHYAPGRGLLGQYQHRPGDPTSLPSRRVTDVVSDRRGRLWVATWDGLARRQGDGFVTYKHDPADPGSLPENNLHRLYEDRAGTLWIGTGSGFLAALCDGCDEFRSYRLGPVGGGELAEAIFEDSRGNLWIGGRTGGLYRLDRENGWFDTFRSDPDEPGGLSHDSVTAIIEDSRGRLWLGTQGGGVNRMTLDADGDPVFTSYGINEGLSTNAVGGLAEDARGRIWISTTAGISRLDPATGRIVNFDAAAGAQIMGYFVGAFDRFPDGRIAFGGMQGVTVFHPGNVRPLPSPHDVAVTEMTVLSADNGTAHPMPVRLLDSDVSELPLPPDANHISIEISALSYATPGLLRYAHRLDGLDEDWVEVDATHRRVSYNSLRPGSYVFRARARTAQGDWSEELVLPIRLKAAWWESDLAKLGYLLGILVLLAGIAWAIRQRREEREATQREIADSEQRLKLALWGTGDELWDWDLAHGQLRRQNPLDRPDADTDEVVESAARLRDWIHPDDQALFDQALAGHRSGPGDSMEASYRARTRDGQWRWRLSRGRVVARDAAGQPTRIVGTNSDITRLKENELELARINAELETRVRQRTLALHETNESLRSTIDELRQTQQHLVEAEKMAALGGLVAGIAHEINTPLGVSVTAASYLEQEARHFEQQLEQDAEHATPEHAALNRSALERFRVAAVESSRLILHNLRRADRMIRSFKQVAVDQSSEESRRIDLRAYLDEIMISLQPSLRRHEVVIDCPPGIELDTYPGAIYQIISNLVMNSLMHGFSEDAPGQIRIIVQARPDEVVLRYQDNGVGMDAETCRRVFDPFFTTRRGAGGSGLGMHITWNLATQVLGGSISCESAPGQGARFVLRVPMQRIPR